MNRHRYRTAAAIVVLCLLTLALGCAVGSLPF